MIKVVNRINVLALWFLLFGSLVSCQQDQGLENIKVIYAPEDVHVISDVSCEAFEFEFQSVRKEVVIEKRSLLEGIDTRVKELTEKRNKNAIDARIKAYLNYYQQQTDTICFGVLEGIALNGVQMEEDSILAQHFKDMVWVIHRFLASPNAEALLMRTLLAAPTPHVS
ncbi:MAG: hypothetical protein U5L96_19650 [Owenweeksia sp.]|nr:hypothetical protein [Owenweeksia sp.]